MLRQPVGLLRVGAAEPDQLGRDLRAGAERADADIAAAQLLGDDAHGLLAEAQAALLLGDASGRTRRARPAARSPAAGSARRARASRGEAARPPRRRTGGTGRGSSPGVSSARPQSPNSPSCDQLGQARPMRSGSALGDQLRHRLGAEAVERRCIQAEIARPDDLDLAHRDAAGDPGQVLGEGRAASISTSRSPSRPPASQPPGPALHLAQRLRHRPRARRGRAPPAARARAARVELAAAAPRGLDGRGSPGRADAAPTATAARRQLERVEATGSGGLQSRQPSVLHRLLEGAHARRAWPGPAPPCCRACAGSSASSCGRAGCRAQANTSRHAGVDLAVEHELVGRPTPASGWRSGCPAPASGASTGSARRA